MTLTDDVTVAPTEAGLRLELTECFHLLASLRWDDLVATHASVRLPGRDAYLINPFGLLFEEMTPDDLVTVGLDGRLIDGAGRTPNPNGVAIHGAVLAARRDVNCIIHLHTPDGIAVASLESGLMALNQSALLVVHDLAWQNYEGLPSMADESSSLVEAMGTRNMMLLRNHGTLAAGRTVGSAFTRMFWLESACTIQQRTLSMGGAVCAMPASVVEQMGARLQPDRVERLAQEVVWPAMRRRAARLGTGQPRL
jgi:ribulose-5-phosphate 4-epimerase/fuculose-1-phosphate aldolase